MPILPDISAYRREFKSWPLWIEVDQANQPKTLWQAAGAPNPPDLTLFNSYEPSMVAALPAFTDGFRTVITHLAVCERTVSFKLIVAPDQFELLRPAGTETILREGTILSGLRFIDPRLKNFTCTNAIITEPFLTFPNILDVLTAGKPTWVLLESPPLDRIQGLIDRPGTSPASSIFRITKVPQLFELRPPTEQASRPAPLRRPIRRPPPPTPPNCFDPSTGEKLNCDTGEPTERDPCTEKWIKIPNPDDIIHLTPRPKLPWVKAPTRKGQKQKWKFSRPLDAAETLEFLRRREVRANIERSTVPEFVKSVTDIMTTIDNIQDALLTAIIFARLGIRRLPKSLYRALLAGLGIADALQIIAFGGLDLARMRSIKGRLMREGRALPFSKKWRQDAIERLSRIVPTISEVFQLLQTTDWLFGVGLSLGAILGFILDLLFALPRGAKIRFRDPCLTKVRRDALKNLERLGLIPMGTTERSLREELIIPGLRRLLTEDILLPGRTIREASPTIVSPNPIPAHPFTQAEYAQLLGAYSAFLDMAEETIGDLDTTPLIQAAMQREIQINPDNSKSDSLLEDMGAIPQQPAPTLPIAGNPTSSPLGPVIRMIVPEARQSLLNHIALDPGSEQAFYIGAFAEEIAVKAIRILDPKHETMKWTPKGSFRTLHAIMDRGFIPPKDATTAQIQGALNTLLLRTDLITEVPPEFQTMKRILLAQNWTGP